MKQEHALITNEEEILSKKQIQRALRNLSHEMRNPLLSIWAMTRQLPEEDPSEWVLAMQLGLTKVLEYLEDLDRFTETGSWCSPTRWEMVRLSEVLSGMLVLFQVKASEKPLKVEIQLDDAVPPYVFIPSNQVWQLLFNLMDNAVKYTEEGNVTLQVYQDQQFLHFKVKDTGPGIDPENLEKIFHHQYQVHAEKEGSGIGLALVQELALQMGGEIDVQSEPGHGSCFHFKLPGSPKLSTSFSQNDSSSIDLKGTGASLRGTKVLLVEDDPFIQLLISEDLAAFIPDIEITPVSTGWMALKAFQEKTFDLILMDLNLPEVNGFEATLAIRVFEDSLAGTTRLPIMGMTAGRPDEDLIRCFDAGMNDLITKPYSRSGLISKIHSILRPT